MPVSYDTKGKVIRPNLVHKWTQEMVIEYAKCSKSVKYFALNYCKVMHPTRGIIKLDMRDYQMNMLSVIEENQKSCLNIGRQVGKSTICGLYCLWYAMFCVEPVNIYILANKAKNAQRLLDDIKITYEELPSYLKRGIVEYNKTAIEFDNRSTIYTGPTTKDSIRGESVSFLLLDEFGHVPPHLADEFYQSNIHTISTGGKVCIISTPNGNSGKFYEIYTEAQQGNNGFKSFTIDWKCVPRFDDKGKEITSDDFRDKMIKSTGLQSWLQEHECNFLGSSKTLISGPYLEKIAKTVVDPNLQEGDWLIWERPKNNRIYVLGVDTAKGIERDSSVIQIVDVTNPELLRQVAVFSCNTIDPFDFSEVIYNAAKKFNDAYVVIENNTYGHEVCRRLFNDFEYEKIFKESGSRSWGINSNSKSKSIGTSLLKRYVEADKMIINDDGTFKEICIFVETGHEVFKCENGKNKHDDRIMALVWAIYFINTDFWNSIKDYIIKDSANSKKQRSQKYVDDEYVDDDDEDDDYIDEQLAPIIPATLDDMEFEGNNILDENDFYG